MMKVKGVTEECYFVGKKKILMMNHAGLYK